MVVAFVNNEHRWLMFDPTFWKLLNIPENKIYVGGIAGDIVPLLLEQVVTPKLDLTDFYKIHNSEDTSFDSQIHLLNGKILHLFSTPVHTIEGDFYGRILQATDITRERGESWQLLDNTVAFIGDKWKMLIVNELLTGTKRFTTLRHNLGFSAKVLTQHLRIMEERGLIRREVYNEIPLRVEYSLTKLGYSLKPVFDAMWQWEKEHTHSNVNGYLSNTVAFIGDKRKMLIVNELLTGTKRFTTLHHNLEFSAKVLTQHLRIMEERGLIRREVYNEAPSRTEYSLTELGHSLKPVFDTMRQLEDQMW